MSRTPIPYLAVLVLVVTTLSSSPARSANPDDPTIFGYAYLEHSAGPHIWTVGNEFTILTIGHPNDLAIVPLDDVANEYTVVLENAVVRNYSVSGATGFVEFETGMVFSVYEDSRATGTPADFGTVAPPNTVAPSTFTDGTRIAFSGTQSEEFYLRINLTTGNGFFVWDEGLPLKNCALLGPGFDEWFVIVGWVALPGADASPPLEIPAPGYEFRLMAETDCDSPLQPENATWGEVKAIYR